MAKSKAEKVFSAAEKLRDLCFEQIAEYEEQGEDRGDARVTINGNDKFATDVLYVLNAIGVPKCMPWDE